MTAHHDAAPQESAAQAIDRVLGAERDADASVELARRQAQALHEMAREDALAIVNRSMQRIARWQQAHAAALEQRLTELRAATLASAGAQQRIDESSLAAAVAQVAQMLTANMGRPHRDDAS